MSVCFFSKKAFSLQIDNYFTLAIFAGNDCLRVSVNIELSHIEKRRFFAPGVTGIDDGIHIGAVHQSAKIFKSVLLAGCQHIAERLRQNGKIIIAPFLETFVIAASIHRGYQVPYTPGHKKAAALIKAVGPG